MSGKLLAHFLASDNSIFCNHSVTLIGFSLGSQVSKSCVNRLAQLKRSDIIHNVYFLAGATFIKDRKNVIQKNKFQIAVSGRTSNVYSQYDTSLSTFNLVFKEKSIGRSPQYEKCHYNAACPDAGKKKYRFENYDVSKFISGHLEYHPKQDLILEFIQFDS